jgi:hypothetical protein
VELLKASLEETGNYTEQFENLKEVSSMKSKGLIDSP